jgi:hypothetical protein
MNFILTIIVCSAIHQSCLQPMVRMDKTFETWSLCMKEGYKDSLQIVEKLGDQTLNELHTVIKFTCTPKKPKRTPTETGA